MNIIDKYGEEYEVFLKNSDSLNGKYIILKLFKDDLNIGTFVFKKEDKGYVSEFSFIKTGFRNRGLSTSVYFNIAKEKGTIISSEFQLNEGINFWETFKTKFPNNIKKIEDRYHFILN